MKKLSQFTCACGAFAGLVYAVTAVTPAVADSAQFSPLGCLAEPGQDGCRSIGAGVSADGMVVVGRTHVETSPGVLEMQAFRWTAETGMVALGSLPGGTDRSMAMGISGDGSTIVGEASSNGFTLEAFAWQADGQGMIGLGGFTLPAGIRQQGFSSAWATSHDGSVIAGSALSLEFSGPGGMDMLEAFVTNNGELLALGKLPGGMEYSMATDISGDGSAVVGVSGSADGWQAFRWTMDGGMIGLGSLPGTWFNSLARAISADGSTVVGRSRIDVDIDEAFRWTEAEGMVGIGLLPGGNWLESVAHAVSADGSVIVGRSTSHNEPVIGESFIWTHSAGMRSLRQELELQGAAGLDGWSLNHPSAISEDGLTIVGTGSHPELGEQAWVARLAHLPVLGDLTGDGKVGVSDLLVLLGAWGTCPNQFDCPADFNLDGEVNVSDVLILLANWG